MRNPEYAPGYALKNKPVVQIKIFLVGQIDVNGAPQIVGNKNYQYQRYFFFLFFMKFDSFFRAEHIQCFKTNFLNCYKRKWGDSKIKPLIKLFFVCLKSLIFDWIMLYF